MNKTEISTMLTGTLSAQSFDYQTKLVLWTGRSASAYQGDDDKDVDLDIWKCTYSRKVFVEKAFRPFLRLRARNARVFNKVMYSVRPYKQVLAQ